MPQGDLQTQAAAQTALSRVQEDAQANRSQAENEAEQAQVDYERAQAVFFAAIPDDSPFPTAFPAQGCGCFFLVASGLVFALAAHAAALLAGTHQMERFRFLE